MSSFDLSSPPLTPFALRSPASSSPQTSPTGLWSPRSPLSPQVEQQPIQPPVPIGSVPPLKTQLLKRGASLSISASLAKGASSLRRRRAATYDQIMSEAEKQAVPPSLVAGVPMLKISSKKMKQVVMRLEGGAISWAGSGNSKGQLPTLWRK